MSEFLSAQGAFSAPTRVFILKQETSVLRVCRDPIPPAPPPAPPLLLQMAAADSQPSDKGAISSH